MSFGYYAPDGRPIDFSEWAEMSGSLEHKIVKQENVCGEKFWVSTVYLGLDHSFGDDGPPLIFESMIFTDGPLDQECRRYSTREQALEGHAEMVRRCEFANSAMFGDIPGGAA